LVFGFGAFSACDGGSGSAPSAASDEKLPCGVVHVLERNCVSCHGRKPRMAAPMSLVTAADFRAQRPGGRVSELVLDRIASAARPMPPPPAARLDSAQVAEMRAWITSGARAAADGCRVRDTDANGGEGGGGQGSQPRDAAVTSTKDAAGSTTQPTSTTRAAWPMYGHDLANSRAALDETAITPSTVSSLTRAWEYTGAASSSTPAVFDGTLYLTSWDGTVRALAVTDGAEQWSTTLPSLIDSSPAVTATQIFVSDSKGSVHALDRRSGTLVWSVLVDPHPQVHLWSSPIYLEDAQLVVVGVASYEEIVSKPAVTFRGSVVALDAATGKERWRFYTTGADANEGAGVAVWATATVDVGRHALYVGTGNNYGQPSGPLEDSLLALDYDQGALLWSTQFMSDDIFSLEDSSGPDYDIGSTANLFAVAGQDAIGIGIKSGTYAALNRDSGHVEWKAQASPGGLFGGVISSPAYADGVVYVAGNDGAAGETIVSALDVESGQFAWQRRLPMQSFSGVAYAGGVVFVGTMAGTIYALAAADGSNLWSDVMPDVAGSAVVVDGALYVSWGYQLALGTSDPGLGGVIAYRSSAH
jgi:polyvinyl alcohol dehydrogenase (cytochrome)